MANVILFHHACGLTGGVVDFADRLREMGHTVTVPDLYDGATFTTVEEGVAHAKELGFEKVIDAASEEASELGRGVVYAGFSLGAMAAHRLAQTTPGAAGALLYHHGDVPIETFGDSWPAGLDLQIHISEGDEYYEPEVVEHFIAQAGGAANAEVFVYPGSGHLFTDSSLSEFDEPSTTLVLERTLEFLDRLG